MNFCNNLQKLRKKKNISQEQLAEELGVTRQAVSKWESGASYPEMDKLILLCKIFNCELDVLVNKNIEEVEDCSTSKKILENFFREVGEGVTKTIHMIEQFGFKELIKFIIQILIIILIIVICRIPFLMIEDAICHTFMSMNNLVGNMLSTFWHFIITLGYSIFAVIMFFYVYKVKFLDVITIEEKKENKENKENYEHIQVQEKSKHVLKSNKMTVLEFLMMLMIWFIKFLIIMFMFPTVMCLIIMIVCFVFLFIMMFKGLFLIGPMLITLGIIVFGITLIEILFNFIVNRKSNFKRVFITMLSSIIVFSVGIVPSILYFTNIEIINKAPEKFQSKTKEEVISMNEQLFIHDYYYGEINYQYDETLIDQVKVNITYYKDVYNPTLTENQDGTYSIHVEKPNRIKTYTYTDEIIKNLKEKKLYSYNDLSNVKVEVVSSKENIDKIKLNKTGNNQETY